MARELRLEETTAPSQSTPELSNTSSSDDAPHREDEHEMTWKEGIEESAKELELEAMVPARPDAIQLSVMEYVYLWVTPFPDEFWTKIIAACVAWPPSHMHEWFQFRREIAVRAAKGRHLPHPFRKPHDVVSVEVEGRTIDLRAVALGSRKPWSDARFARLVHYRFDVVSEKWNERYAKVEYEAQLVREYHEQVSGGELELEC